MAALTLSRPLWPPTLPLVMVAVDLRSFLVFSGISGLGPYPQHRARHRACRTAAGLETHEGDGTVGAIHVSSEREKGSQGERQAERKGGNNARGRDGDPRQPEQLHTLTS